MPENNNPLLQRIRIPGETFRLPSRGRYYTHGELSDDVVDGEVHVLPMTTVDELAFKSADKLFTGQAIAEVFARRIPQINKPLQLLSKDVDYLIMCLRLVSYGDSLEMTIKHTCEHAEEHEYQFSIRDVLKSTREIDPTKSFQIAVPDKDGQLVNMKPPAFEDVLRIYQVENKLEELDDTGIIDAIANNIASMISDVDGVDNREMVVEWLQQIPAGWANKIANEVAMVSNWGVSPSKTIKCPDCGEDWTIELPVNPVTFFTLS